MTCTVDTLDTGHTRGSAAYRRALAALFCAGLASFAQLYAPQAVLPQVAAGLNVSSSHAALLISVATVGLAVGVIPWSMVSDRIGRVPTMSVAVVAATVLGLATPFAPTLPMLLAGRFLEGLMVGAVPVIALTYLTEEIDPRHTARAAGTYVAGTTIGGLTGRLLAGPVAELTSWRVGVFAVSVLCAVAAAAFILLIPRQRGFVAVRGRGGDPDGGLGRRLAANLRSPHQLSLFTVVFLLMGGFVALYNFLGFRLAMPPFDLPQTLISLVFAAYLAGTWSAARSGSVATRFGRKPVLLASTAVMAAGVAATLTGNVVVILAGLVVATAGFFGAHAVASGWVTRHATVGKAQASSLYNLSYYAGSSLFGWLGGVMLDGFGWAGVAVMILGLTATAAALAAAVLNRG